MVTITRDQALIGTAAVLAIAIPAILLWPHEPELHDPASIAMTAIPPIRLVLTGEALKSPLFNGERSPSPTPDTTSGGPNAQGAQSARPPTLVGLALGGGSGVALLKPASGETVSAKVGDEVAGWRVLAISPTHVTLSQGSQRIELGFELGNRHPPTSGSAPSSTTPAPPNAAGAQMPIPLPPSINPRT